MHEEGGQHRHQVTAGHDIGGDDRPLQDKGVAIRQLEKESHPVQRDDERSDDGKAGRASRIIPERDHVFICPR
jgi:hypothetical protein